MISSFEREQDIFKKVALSKEIMNFALVSGSGFFTIPEIENFYLDLAEKLEDDSIANNKYPDSFLHVMTKAYPTGGHSRVVARWINSSAGNQKHSVFLLNQENVEIPSDIKDAVTSRHGILYVSENKNLFENARYLRKISKQYSRIVLHIHPDDPTSIITYGIDSFTTPVILYNHADHNYWCGSSIVDVVADIRDNDISKIYRDVKNTFLLRIPIETNLDLEKSSVTVKNTARHFLGIPLEEKVLLTVGRATKYKPIGRIEFCEIVSHILDRVPNSKCYGIGPTKKTGNWASVPSRFLPLGEISYGEKYIQYLHAADLYVDSIPIYGGTSVIDAVQAHIPVVSYKVFKSDFGNLIEGIERVSSLSNFIETSIQLLENPQYAVELSQKQLRAMQKFHCTAEWEKQMTDLINKVNNISHIVRREYKKNRSDINERNVFLCYNTCSTKDKRICNNDFLCIKRFLFFIWDKI